MTLIYIIKEKKDTVALKRAGTMENYSIWIDKISSIKKYNVKQIEKISNECIEGEMSFGGSADILIAAIFLHFITLKGYLLKFA